RARGTTIPDFAVFNRQVISRAVPEIDLARTGDFLVAVLEHLDPLREPARGARNGEQHREHIYRQAHRLIDYAGVEVHIRIELTLDEVFIFERDPFQLERDVEQWIFSGDLENFVGYLLDYLRARVVVLINAVPESHQSELTRLHPLDVL